MQGQPLQLNGAGVRSRFFFDIYVGALYLQEVEHRAERILLEPAPVRVTMHILYAEVDAEKLVDGWTAGFEKNLDDLQMQALEARLQAFNGIFADAHRGDVLMFDFLPDGSTRVVINGVEKGVLQGMDFQRALMSVWLGEHPADPSLKKAMLGLD